MKNKRNWNQTEMCIEVPWASYMSYLCQGKFSCKVNGASQRHSTAFCRHLERPFCASYIHLGKEGPFTRNWCVFSFSCSDSFQLGTCLGADLLLSSFHESIFFLYFVSWSSMILAGNSHFSSRVFAIVDFLWQFCSPFLWLGRIYFPTV